MPQVVACLHLLQTQGRWVPHEVKSKSGWYPPTATPAEGYGGPYAMEWLDIGIGGWVWGWGEECGVNALWVDGGLRRAVCVRGRWSVCDR